jgi:hypothetical protein
MAMTTAPKKMIRKHFLVSPATARRLERLAAARGTSASEVVRQAIDSYDVTTVDSTGSDELVELVSLRLKDAIKSTRRAHRTVVRTLRQVDARD